jgi:hypothetical protein
MIFRRLRQLSEAKVIKLIQKPIKNHLIFRSFTNQYAINHNISFIVIIYLHKVITTIKKTHYLCPQIIISIFLTFKPDAARANVVLKLMLEKNKKFRVIEEGVMNQGEMGVIKGGKICDDKFWTCDDEYGSCRIEYLICKANNVIYNSCPTHLIVAPPICLDSYHLCGENDVY